MSYGYSSRPGPPPPQAQPGFDPIANEMQVAQDRQSRSALDALRKQQGERFGMSFGMPMGAGSSDYFQRQHDASDLANLESIQKTGNLAPTRIGLAGGDSANSPYTSTTFDPMQQPLAVAGGGRTAAQNYDAQIGTNEPDFGRFNRSYGIQQGRNRNPYAPTNFLSRTR